MQTWFPARAPRLPAAGPAPAAGLGAPGGGVRRGPLRVLGTQAPAGRDKAEGRHQFQAVTHPILLLFIPAVANEKQIKFHSTLSAETI